MRNVCRLRTSTGSLGSSSTWPENTASSPGWALGHTSPTRASATRPLMAFSGASSLTFVLSFTIQVLMMHSDCQVFPGPCRPFDLMWQQHRSRSNAIAGRIDALGWHPLIAQGHCRIHQTSAHADNTQIGATEALDHTVLRMLALGNRLILQPHARNAKEFLPPVYLPID